MVPHYQLHSIMDAVLNFKNDMLLLDTHWDESGNSFVCDAKARGRASTKKRGREQAISQVSDCATRTDSANRQKRAREFEVRDHMTAWYQVQAIGTEPKDIGREEQQRDKAEGHQDLVQTNREPERSAIETSEQSCCQQQQLDNGTNLYSSLHLFHHWLSVDVNYYSKWPSHALTNVFMLELDQAHPLITSISVSHILFYHSKFD